MLQPAIAARRTDKGLQAAMSDLLLRLAGEGLFEEYGIRLAYQKFRTALEDLR